MTFPKKREKIHPRIRSPLRKEVNPPPAETRPNVKSEKEWESTLG